MSQMASAMLRGVSKYSLVHYWSLEVCQPLRCESVQYSLGGREGKRWGISAKEDRERKISFFFLVLLLGFVCLQALFAVIPFRTRCCMVPLCFRGHGWAYFGFDFFPLTFSASSSLWHTKYESAGLSMRLAYWKADKRQVSESVFMWKLKVAWV